MLRVRIDNREVEVTPVALAELVLDGQVSRHHLTKTSDGAAERPLEYALDPPHCEALTAELLRRLQSMSSGELEASDIDPMRARAEALCQWHWREPDTRARLLWAAAWLNELVDRLDAAVTYYDTFLRVRCREPHLRLLAYNNRGVLRLRLGRCAGIQDVARSAIVAEQGALNPERSAGLPTACFNLLNLVNVAAQTDSLSEAVDEELADFFAQLPEEVTLWWLGSAAVEAFGSPGGGTGATARHFILRDADCRRLNRLTANLATRAMKLTETVATDSSESAHVATSRLCLWSGETGQNNGAGGDGAGHPSHPEDDFALYADAAGLLLADEIPSALVGDKGPGGRVEQMAEEELAEIEDLMVAGNHDLARSRLEVQRRVLATLSHRERLASLLAQVDTLLRRVDRAKQEQAQLELQRACGNLVCEVDQFCQVANAAQAQRKLGSLRQRLQSYRAEAPTEAAPLLDELAQRLGRHMQQLQQSEVRKTVAVPLAALRENWPADWAVPVPDAAYAALAECLVNDPEGQVEDWPTMRDQLDAHQAQYCLRKALAELPGDRASWDEIESVLVDALRLAPELWGTTAPLFGMFASPNGHGSTPTAPDVRMALESAAGRLLGENQGPHLLRRAGSLLDRGFRELRGDARRFVRLWSCLERTLTPMLESAGEEMITEIEALARMCLNHWPAARTELPSRADPRNPVRIFLESCEKMRCLAQAEQLLTEQSPAFEKTNELVTRALHLGLDTVEQSRRAAAILYLIAYSHEDAPPRQRQVLARLDTWVANAIIDMKRFTEQESIMTALAAIRADVLVAPSASDTQRTEAADQPDV